MATRRLTVALQVLLVFASGALVGGLAYRLYLTRSVDPMVQKLPPRPPDKGQRFRERYVEEMRSRLDLRADQVKKLEEIMDTTGRKFWDAKKRNDAEMRNLQENQVAQIRAMLDPPQVVEYERMLREREARMKRDREFGRRRGP
ncbi:MAG TPA: hypothetical protein VLH09_15120 [Bryobacteraceae bacterium]|nr:hypothetical protein [Bryobacteraceae bacterium]